MRTAVWKPSLAPSTKASYTFTFLRTPAQMKLQMMLISRMLATVVLVRFIVSGSMREKVQMMAATTAQAPPSVSSMVRFSRLMRW